MNVPSLMLFKLEAFIILALLNQYSVFTLCIKVTRLAGLRVCVCVCVLVSGVCCLLATSLIRCGSVG